MSASSLTTLHSFLRQTLRSVLVTLVAALLALMTVQIVLRYGFNSSLLWAEEMSRYMLIWLSFLAVILAYERGEIAALTILSDTLPRIPALLLGLLGILLSLALCLLLVWYGWVFADRAGSSSIPGFGFLLESLFGDAAPATPQFFWIYVALPFGMALLALGLLADGLACLRAIGSGETLGAVMRARADREKTP